LLNVSQSLELDFHLKIASPKLYSITRAETQQALMIVISLFISLNVHKINSLQWLVKILRAKCTQTVKETEESLNITSSHKNRNSDKRTMVIAEQ
jgi:hypothetical protein